MHKDKKINGNKLNQRKHY